ncbi:hypothetical protein K1T71_013795 [Dendrolimus kikuchii]|uniref:Uncharacterized protein n=1 Tax=Dendrolimus kikuchii TaxID=765133 RepID=A0ACC1CG23_9NEOP|nr:hypothetical protein K1T71_013795 [Dendrolimus kikuchii]
MTQILTGHGCFDKYLCRIVGCLPSPECCQCGAPDTAGLINTLIDNLPIELHLPGYNFCGPGTKLKKRLKRGDKGINPLDEACKHHDIAYAQNSSLEHRHTADLELASAAEKRWRESKDLSERVAALAVNKLMKFKVKRGMGLTKVIKAARKHRCNNKLVSAAIKAAKKSFKHKGGVRKPRVIALPKKGGFLPLLPILGALAALNQSLSRNPVILGRSPFKISSPTHCTCTVSIIFYMSVCLTPQTKSDDTMAASS